MSGRLVRAPLARADVIGVANFLKSDNPGVARRFLEASRRAMQRLAEMPMLGSECESDAPGLAELRVWPIPRFPNHLILYRIIPGGIRVVRVVHGAQDWQNLFR